MATRTRISPAEVQERLQRIEEREDAIERAIQAQRALDRLEQQVEKARRARDVMVRRANARKVNRSQLALDLGISRATLYEAINRPLPEADDDEWQHWAEWIDQAWQHAENRWHEAGEVGLIDDYFPLL